MNELERGTCLSCLGSGEVSSERGLARCPDCDGLGKIGSEFKRSEQRLREIEGRAHTLQGESASDVKWLIGDLRRYREVLVRVMTAAQDGASADAGDEAVELLRRIQFEVNEVLEIYAPSTSSDV